MFEDICEKVDNEIYRNDNEYIHMLPLVSHSYL